MESAIEIKCKNCGHIQEAPNPKRARLESDGKAEQEELNFYKLFTAVLDFLIQRDNIPDENISNSISSIIKSFQFDNGNKFSDVDYGKMENLCGYLYRYATHGAGLVRNRVCDAINNCEALAECLKKPELNIVSLGGGPGNDMVGFCSALYYSQCRSILNLMVVDSVRRWASVLNILEFFVREGNYGDVSELFRQFTVNLSFLQTTLPGNTDTDQKYFRSIREADVILIPKLMSILLNEEKIAVIKVSTYICNLQVFLIQLSLVMKGKYL